MIISLLRGVYPSAEHWMVYLSATMSMNWYEPSLPVVTELPMGRSVTNALQIAPSPDSSYTVP